MIKNVRLAKGATRQVTYYEMTKDGFVFLVMGFTDKKAAQFKEAYIAEFNRMEAQLISSITEFITSKNRRIVTHYQNSTPTYYQRILREDEHIATLKSFLALARRTKFLVARTEDLENFLLNKCAL